MNIIGEAKIVENSFSRIVKRAQEHDYVILTAFRGEKSQKENRSRNNQMLKKYFTPKKLGGMMLKGNFQETNTETGEKKIVSEESFFITRSNNVSQKEFKKIVLDAINEFDQESAFIKIGDEIGFIERDGNIFSMSGKFAIDKKLSPKELQLGWSNFGKNKFVYEGHCTPKHLSQSWLFRSNNISWIVDTYFDSL